MNDFEVPKTDELEILNGQLDENLINDLREEIGAESNEQTEAAASGVISSLVAGLNKNAEKPGGLAGLLSALDRDHDGSVLDDAVGILFGRRKLQNPRTTNGPGILEHILGNKQNQVNDALGRATGLDKGKILKLMITLAPLVLGVLGRARNRRGFKSDQIGDLLRGTVQNQTAERKGMGLLKKLLDSDGDGKVIKEIANLGMNAFLSRRK